MRSVEEAQERVMSLFRQFYEFDLLKVNVRLVILS